MSLAVTAIVMVGVMSLLGRTVSHARDAIALSRLAHTLHTTANIIAQDVARAGYWAQSSSNNNNPFMQVGTTNIQINGSSNCVLMTYDRNGDGLLPAITAASDDERYGYRLMNQSLQYRPYGATFDCAASASDWENMSDDNSVEITAFNVAQTNYAVDIDGSPSTTPAMERRRLSIDLTGQLIGDSSSQHSVSKTVILNNDRYSP